MFGFFKKAKKEEESRYVSVMFDATECGHRIALLTATRERMAAMPNECDRDKVLEQIDEELVDMVKRFGDIDYIRLSEKDYSKFVNDTFKKNVGL